jgi:hypothetical protein
MNPALRARAKSLFGEAPRVPGHVAGTALGWSRPAPLGIDAARFDDD